MKLLDFACGTGRITAALEPLVGTADAIDISPEMVAVAQKKCSKARFQVGDILLQPQLLQKDYDVITAFRFLLNVESEIRRQALRRLQEVIAPNGILIVNVHGNSRSLRQPAILWRRWRERRHPTNAMLNTMSLAEARQLLQDSGFRISRQYGFGILPPTLYRTPLRRAAFAVDKLLAGPGRRCGWSIDMLFVCHPV